MAAVKSPHGVCAGAIMAAVKADPSHRAGAAIPPTTAAGAVRGRSSRPAPRSSSALPARDVLPSPAAAANTARPDRRPSAWPCTPAIRAAAERSGGSLAFLRDRARLSMDGSIRAHRRSSASGLMKRSLRRSRIVLSRMPRMRSRRSSCSRWRRARSRVTRAERLLPQHSGLRAAAPRQHLMGQHQRPELPGVPLVGHLQTQKIQQT